MLARASARQKEMAVRLALGASRWRVLRQLLTESVMLAFAGGAIGSLLAYWAIDAVKKGIPVAMSKYIPGWNQIGLNYRVLGFTLLFSVVTGVIFGLAPAWQSTKADLNETLKAGGGKGTAGKSGGAWGRNALVVAQVALSLVLLIGAGLFVRSFVAMLNTDLGVKPAGVMTMQLALPREQYAEPQQLRNFFNQLVERTAALPGVTHVGLTHDLPMSGGRDANRFQITGQPAFEDGKEPHTDYRLVTPDYFAAIGTDLRRGRMFTAQDNEQSQRVVLANEAFVARFMQGREAIGQHITMGNENLAPMEIVGVVANTMNEDLNNLAEPCVYLPFAQNPAATMSLVIRAPGRHLQLTPEVRRELAVLDPRLPLTEVKPMQEVIHERRSPLEMMMWMLVIYGVMALAMATVGTYALMAYAVSQRTQEIGVRLALGAQTADILKLVMGRGLLLTLIGVALGLAGSFAMTRALAQFLYGVSATDTLTFAGVSLLLTAIALLACWLPARRAASIDPLIALRHE
jgi:putative ABC transport system permease protein